MVFLFVSLCLVVGNGGLLYVGTQDNYLYTLDFNEGNGALSLTNTMAANNPSCMMMLTTLYPIIFLLFIVEIT